MNKLKKLQKDYQAGKITKEQYDAAVAELLGNEDINQEAHDEALEFDPEEDNDDDKPIYTQADMDRVVVKKARQLVRKQLKDAGGDLEGVTQKDLLPKIVELVQAGENAGKEESDLTKELKQLKPQAEKAAKLESQVQVATVENAVLKAAGKYKPHNAAQVVRALNADYRDLLEYDDENGILIPKSVDRAIKRIAEAEPNLFQDAGGEDDDPEGGALNTGEFKGKPPGGGSSNSTSKKDKEYAAKKAKALEMIGIKKDQK